MKSDQLLTILKTTIGKQKVVELADIVAESDFSMKELIHLSLHKDDQIGFRAAWILEQIYTNHNDRFIPFATYFLDRFSAQNNLSARRHYAKILAFITSRKAPFQLKQLIKAYDTDLIVETVFSWVIDEKVPVAVKSQCLNVLGNLNLKHDWIKEEINY